MMAGSITRANNSGPRNPYFRGYLEVDGRNTRNRRDGSEGELEKSGHENKKDD